jgi:SHS2 domain-containing protein
MSEQKFVFLDHTADAKFRAFGKTLEEAFENSARALVSLMWDAARLKKVEKIAIHINGNDLKQLLLNYLEEILYLLNTQEFLLAEVISTRILSDDSGFRLSTVFKGDRFKKDYKIFGEVKAVTYDEMKIEEEDGWMVQVVVDL